MLPDLSCLKIMFRPSGKEDILKFMKTLGLMAQLEIMLGIIVTKEKFTQKIK